MPKFQTKPVVVDGVRFIEKDVWERTRGGSGLDLVTGASFRWGPGPSDPPVAMVLTRDGRQFVADGDWIVTYVDGGVEVWKPSTFAAMWEQVTG